MAIVIVTAKVNHDIKFLIGKESMFLRDIQPDVKKYETFPLPGDYMAHYTATCKKLSYKYGMRVQFDTPDIYPGHTRARFRYIDRGFRYGVVKGASKSTDATSLDTAIREFNEEVMPFENRSAFRDMNMVIHMRDLYMLHFNEPTLLCTTIASRTNMYYGEMFEMELRNWDVLQDIWSNLNVVSKRSLETIKP